MVNLLQWAGVQREAKFSIQCLVNVARRSPVVGLLRKQDPPHSRSLASSLIPCLPSASASASASLWELRSPGANTCDVRLISPKLGRVDSSYPSREHTASNLHN